MAKYLITPSRTIFYAPVEIEAEDEGEALDKFRDDDWITDDLTETNSHFDYEVAEAPTQTNADDFIWGLIKDIVREDAKRLTGN